MFELSNERKHDAAAYMELSMVTQKLQKRLGQETWICWVDDSFLPLGFHTRIPTYLNCLALEKSNTNWPKDMPNTTKDADKISKNWYSKFELSFDVKQVTSVTSPDHHWVKLTLPGRKRAESWQILVNLRCQTVCHWRWLCYKIKSLVDRLQLLFFHDRFVSFCHMANCWIARG